MFDFQPIPKRFIAWDKHWKKWVPKFLMPSTDDEESGNWTCPLTLGRRGQAKWLNNDQLIICQSTGLFNRDGEEFFEGSIIESTGGWRGVVVQYKGQWVVSYITPTPQSWRLLYDTLNSIKIIGHVLSDPNLLKKEHDKYI